jgi:hypothetical protein
MYSTEYPKSNMLIRDVLSLAGFSRNHANTLRYRGQLPYGDPSLHSSIIGAFLLSLQSEIKKYGASVNEAADIIEIIGDDICSRWGEVIEQPTWLVVTYDSPKIGNAAETIQLLAKSLRNGSRQSWTINLHELVEDIIVRAKHLEIEIPDPEDWWDYPE